MTGELNGAVGMLPVAFVDTIPSSLPLKGAEKEQDVGVVSTVPAAKVTVVMTWLIVWGVRE